MRLKLISLIALLGVILAACGGPAAPASTTAPATATTAPAASASTPQSGTPTPVPAVTEPAGTPAGTPAPTPDIQKIVNPQPEDWQIGAKDAKVTIIEWADFQCPYCAEAAPLLRRLVSEYPNDVQLIYRYFPLPTHELSLLTTQAAEAAGAQGKFWEMEELLFKNQSEWSAQSGDAVRNNLAKYAEQIGVDVKKFNDALDKGTYLPKAQAARDLADQLGLPGTPFLLVNQQPWPQDLSYLAYPNLKGIVKFFAELPGKQFKAAPPMTIDKTKTYTALVKTDKGDFTLKLFADKAPIAVNNFVFLAKAGWYNDVPFHRVLEGFVAQAGDPSGLGYGGPGYTFDNEITGLKFDREGLVAMANAGTGQDGKGTNGSQFFITLAAASQLDSADPTKEAKYTIFGEVSDGMSVVKSLTIRDPQKTPEVEPSVIKSITIEEK